LNDCEACVKKNYNMTKLADKNEKSLVFYSEEDRLTIRKAYRDLLKSMKVEVSLEDSRNIRRAYEMAVEAHSEQRRKSGEPYILHPIEVARICAEEIGLGPTAIVAALLHDVVEDTKLTLEDIRAEFGEKIQVIVDGLTKLDENDTDISPQAENFRKILGTLVVDVRIALIKMADRMHNMRTLGSMPQHKQLKIAAETEYIYAPLAHRLGLYAFKSEFMDLCLKITNREVFNEIKEKLKETKVSRAQYISAFISPIEQQLQSLGIKFRISGRPKSIYSIYSKIKAKNVPFEEIYDLFAIRIILDVPLEREKAICWQTYSVVTSVHTPIPERLKDWITIPKANGYESLHTTVIGLEGRYVEVQIRSERMDEIAERGYAAHFKYKGIRQERDVFEGWLDSVREMVGKANTGDSSVDYIQDFRANNLFTEEVYVYTPKGDLRVLPKGATALDFAFDIHSEVGYHCQAVKVAGKIVNLAYKLQNGDQVTVETNKSRKPSEDWLKWVMTAKARERIRQAMREEQRAQAEFGKEALQRKFNNLKLEFDHNLDILVKYFGFRTRQELYTAITRDTINLQEDLKVFKIEKNKLVLPEDETTKNATLLNLPAEPQKSRSGLALDLFISGQPAAQYEYQLADCCKPMQGDDVFAFAASNNVMKIHRTNCNNATNLMSVYGYRILKAEWGSSVNSSFVAELLITGIDSGPGMIERLSSKISSGMGLDIRAFSIEGNEGYFEGHVRITVSNRAQLDWVIASLRTLAGVSNVIRVD
jgi:GTP diphosphokinase / guanosine-3',5'-bis(diphosphate) 3'-diphosphatase